MGAWEGFPKELKQRRKAAALTQVELAKRVGVTSNTIARLESGNRAPSMELVEKLAKVFRCDVAELIPKAVQRTLTRIERLIARVERLEKKLPKGGKL